jgi:hypothetical protein
MADIASTRASNGSLLDEPNQGADSRILLLAAAAILAGFLVIALTHPSGVGDGADYVPTMFGL